MQDVNDDMDDLFKKAAEHYPLNTNSSDWNEVYKSLPILSAPLETTGKKNKSRRLLWLLLLLPLMAVLYNYVFNPVRQNIPKESRSEKYHLRTPEQKDAVTENSVNNTAKEVVKGTDNGASKTVIKEPLHPIEKETTPNIKKGISTSFYKRALGSPHKNTSTSLKETALTSVGTPSSLQKTVNKLRIQTRGKLTANGISIRRSTMENSLASLGKNIGVENRKNNPGVINVPAIADNNKEDGDKSTAAIRQDEINDKIDTVVEINSQAASQIDKPQNKLLPASGELKPYRSLKASKINTRKQHFYAGLIIGPDVSTIKLQKITKTGFTAGLIAGYRFNKKWSIESGLYLDKKYYFTDGKYFSTKKIHIPSTVKIENADGYCKMTEVPLNLKYTFRTTQKGNWFALTGISSYFMKKEDYGYELSSYGQMPWQHEYSYNSSSKNWLSIINLSAGYSRNIGKTGIFRIEPYIKMPIKSIGIGNLPVTSSGVYLGFTKNLF